MQRQGIAQRAKILRILSSRKFVSGESIARACRISRIATWKHINYLISRGVKIKIHPNKGYQFLGLGERLLPEILELFLKKDGMVNQIFYFDEIDSTNEYAKRILKPNSLIIAEQQKKGKGRAGRIWYSRKYKDLLFTLILSPQLSYPYLPLFSVIGALAVASGIEKLFSLKVNTRWPNDVLLNGKKVSGVLVEFTAELDIIENLILGIGVDVNSRPRFRYSTSLSAELGRKVERAHLLSRILQELENLYRLVRRRKYEQIQKIWKSYSCDYRKKVKIVQEKRKIAGVSSGIDTYGNLLLKRGKGFSIIYPTSSVRLL